MKNSRNKILLNCFPPAFTFFPSPALSALKSSLQESGFTVDIKYWNIALKELERSFFNSGDMAHDSVYSISTYSPTLALKYNDNQLFEYLIYRILYLKPHYHRLGKKYLLQHIIDHANKTTSLINKLLDEIDIDNYLYFGFSSKFYQWIIGNLFAEHLKIKKNTIPIVVGGFSTKEQAITYLKNFSFCDYALWGEGESSLSQLSNYLLQDGELNEDKKKDIPCLAYREGHTIESNRLRNNYINLEELPIPDFSDFILQAKDLKNNRDINLSIEGGRSCHWGRCHFCFLNHGYRFRTKSPLRIKEEIEFNIEKYNIYNFIFLDNDIIGNDIFRFRELLYYLDLIKQKYNLFKITLAEFTTLYLTYDLIKKMSLVGFEKIQIGYESPSDKLLSKIEKSNTFSSNLFSIKWLSFFHIKIDGLNVLRTLLEEDSHDIKEGIENIFYLRFFLNEKIVTHHMSHLAISKSSPYYKKLQDSERLKKWHFSTISKIVPATYVKKGDEYILFDDFINPEYNKLWDVFENLNKHYSSSQYSYRLAQFNQSVLYYEYCNDMLINEVEFNINDVHWRILVMCNKEIRALKDLIIQLNTTEEKIVTALNSLVDEGLIYVSSDHEKIVSVINTDMICL